MRQYIEKLMMTIVFDTFGCEDFKTETNLPLSRTKSDKVRYR